MTSVYLIRHAQAQGNHLHRFQGVTDSPLTELGIQQAELVASRFRDVPLDALYTSPLQRARKTALAIARPHGLTPISEPGLIEIDGGAMENVPISDLFELYPAEMECFEKSPHTFAGVGGGESILSVYQRMMDTVLEIVRRHPGCNVALVSHGCAIRCFLCFARSYPTDRMGEIEWGANTGVTHVTFDDSLRPTLRSANDISHLQAETTEL